MELLAFGLGLFLLALTFWDLFQTIVVPRPTPGWFRIGRYLIRGSWHVLRGIRDGRPGRSYDRVLGLFAPAATVALLVAWLVALFVGYGLILFAIRDEIEPVPSDLGTTVYFAATSVLTLGFGDIVAVGGPARIVIAIAAISGLGTVALVVTFLFSLYASYQRREVRVVTLQSAAGAPPSAVALLETYAMLDLRRAPPRALPRLGGMGGRGPRLTRGIPAPWVLPFEPRQPVVDQRPGDGPRCLEPRAHDGDRCPSR